MNARTPADAGLLLAAARLAELDLDQTRAAELVPVMDGVFAMLGTLHADDFGEVPPATSFRASW